MPRMTADDYEKIEKAAGIKGDEGYSVVFHKFRARWYRSVHVFARQPTTQDITQYEDIASKVKFRGSRAEVEGSQTLASKKLYDRLIDRVYDLPVGLKVLGEFGKGGPLSRDEAIDKVPVLVKREAIRDFIGEVYSAARMDEAEGGSDEVVNASEGD